MYPKRIIKIRETKSDNENSFEFEFENDGSDDLSDVENLPPHSSLI